MGYKTFLFYFVVVFLVPWIKLVVYLLYKIAMLVHFFFLLHFFAFLVIGNGNASAFHYKYVPFESNGILVNFNDSKCKFIHKEKLNYRLWLGKNAVHFSLWKCNLMPFNNNMCVCVWRFILWHSTFVNCVDVGNFFFFFSLFYSHSYELNSFSIIDIHSRKWWRLHA